VFTIKVLGVRLRNEGWVDGSGFMVNGLGLKVKCLRIEGWVYGLCFFPAEIRSPDCR
jgi:hypothetical protein